MEKTDEAVRVVGLPGSLRGTSYTRRAVELALEGAQSLGAEVALIDLRDYDLGFADGEVGRTRPAPPDLLRLRAEIRGAQGVILGTPEYHGSYSGVLKNALDLMGFQEMQGKMIGLVGVAGGRIGAVNAINGLRMVCRSLRAWVLPDQVSIGRAAEQFDRDGRLKDVELAQRLHELGQQVTRFSVLHHSAQFRQFLLEWEIAVSNPGGGEPPYSVE